jgi:outer membrane protein insertion porin family
MRLIASGSGVQEVNVEQVLIRGNRRIPESTIKIWIGTREGDVYNPIQIDRDVRSLYAQGHFDEVKAFAEDGPRGGKIVTFEVKEWPLVLDIKYEGLKSVPQSKVLEEFRKRQVGISKESQYDPVKAKRAAAVIKELLADEGRPEAKVDPVVEEISKTAVGLTFKIEEGPRFRVAQIEFEGNKVFSSSHLRSKMKLVKQLGLFTTFSSKDIYHKEKLEADLDRLRVLVYADDGYLKARFGEPRVEDVGKVGNWVPIVGHKGQGLKIVIPVEEGRQYAAGEIKVEDNTEFTAEEIKSVLGIKTGDVVKGYTVLQKGLDNLKKLYGSRGYIQFNSLFSPEFHDSSSDKAKGVVDITFTMDEGKQYTLRRLEFIGNTFTRDRVMRREVLLNEGDRYNEQLWDLSLLRLNQLGYFNQIKPEDATINTNEREGQVDVTLKVEEKGRQQISFTGGVSGIGGSYVGISYSTNNLLGYGESLSVDVAAGNRQKVISFGFVEPYLRGRPVSLGFNVFYQDYQFIGQGFGSLVPLSVRSDSLFTQKTKGASVSASAPLSYFGRGNRFRMGRFIRLGLSYTYRTTDILDPRNTDILVTYRQTGVTQSTLTPSLVYNTLNSSLDPTAGQYFAISAALSGGILGGKVSTIQPTVEFRFFRPLFAGREARVRQEQEKIRTFGFRVLFGHIRPFGERFSSNSFSFVDGTPLYTRYFLGGEDSIRGYNIRSISPTAPIESFISTRNTFATDVLGNVIPVRSPRKGTTDTIDPAVLASFTKTNELSATQSQFPTFMGGDTELLLNVEYRIPLVGPLTLAPFFDIGAAFNLANVNDQSIVSEFIPNSILGFQTLNPRGEAATRKELRRARTPETPPNSLPAGYQSVIIRGERQDITKILLSQSSGGFFDNYRYSLGGELRVQVPVINVPFRLIFAYNPNAQVNNPFIFEQKRAIRFSVGRTF